METTAGFYLPLLKITKGITKLKNQTMFKPDSNEIDFSDVPQVPGWKPDSEVESVIGAVLFILAIAALIVLFVVLKKLGVI